MKSRFHGVFSLALVGLSFLTGVYAVMKSSLVFGIVYILLILGLFSAVIYSYCTKCRCRERCRHVVLGKISMLFPGRKRDDLTFADTAATLLSLLVLIAYPQYWLTGSPYLLMIFWGLLVTGGAEILLFVCPSCANTNCALCRDKNAQEIEDKVKG